MPGAAPPGYTGQISLGGATFSFAIDAGSFEREMAKAEQSARAASHRIGQSLGRGSSAAQGLFYLGQTVDDLQYGFRAIVNNIPQLVMASIAILPNTFSNALPNWPPPNLPPSIAFTMTWAAMPFASLRLSFGLPFINL